MPRLLAEIYYLRPATTVVLLIVQLLRNGSRLCPNKRRRPCSAFNIHVLSIELLKHTWRRTMFGWSRDLSRSTSRMANSNAFLLFTRDKGTVFMAYLAPDCRCRTACTSPKPPTSFASFPSLLYQVRFHKKKKWAKTQGKTCVKKKRPRGPLLYFRPYRMCELNRKVITVTTVVLNAKKNTILEKKIKHRAASEPTGTQAPGAHIKF